MTTKEIKEERYLNPYDAIYKLIIIILNFRQAENESHDKFLKRFLDLSSPLNISGTEVTTHSNLKDMECNKLIKVVPNKST